MAIDYETEKKEIQELKDKIVEYFKGNHFDVSLSELMKDLNVSMENLDFFEYCLSELVEEGWVEKSSSMNHNEFDPGEKLNHGGIWG